MVKYIFDSGKKLEVAIGKMEDLPLYLIPKTLVVQMQKMGWSVFQILVVRKLHHKYTVKVETLAARADARPCAGYYFEAEADPDRKMLNRPCLKFSNRDPDRD